MKKEDVILLIVFIIIVLFFIVFPPMKKVSLSPGMGCPACGDFNEDGKVDFFDLGKFSGCWDKSTLEYPDCTVADFSGNGKVDFWDIGPFARHYGSSCEELEALGKSCVGEFLNKNIKNIEMYSNKETFLISDKDWHNVLPLVPLTTWTGNEDCQKGYGTSDNVCVYPMLIYHEEEEKTRIEVSVENFEFRKDSDFEYEVYLSSNNIGVGEFLRLNIDLTYIGKDVELTYIYLDNYPDGLYINDQGSGELGPFYPGETLTHEFIFSFPFVLPETFDVDSIIYFMQQYSPDYLTIIGNTPQELDDLLITAPELGAGLDITQTQRINLEDYLDYWQSYLDVVYVEDNYELALLASTYASLINAPLIIQGTSLDVDSVFLDKNIICVGSVGRSCNEQYTLEQIQQKYVDETNTDKIILVNPDDLNIFSNRGYNTDKSQRIHESFSRDSLAAPILASAKQEVILSINNKNYEEVDNFFTSKLYEYYNVPEITDLSCSLGDSCSLGFEEKSKEIFVAENRIVYSLSQDIDGEGPYNLYFIGNLFNCNGNKIVRLYNNGNFLGEVKGYCSDILGTFFGYLTTTSFYEEEGIYSLEPGTLELEFTNAKFAVDPNNVFSILNADWYEVFRCNSLEECQPSVHPLTISGFFSDITTYYNFNNLDTDSDYYLSARVYGEGIKDASVFVNNNFIEQFEYVSFFGDDLVFVIPKELIGENTEIKIVPNYWPDYSDEEIYYADVKLERDLDLPYFLTVVASPDAIPLATSTITESGCGFAKDVEVDGRIYGSLRNYGVIDLSVGRIMGISVSDVSSYIARDVFYDQLPKNKDALVVIKEDHQSEIWQICNELGLMEITDCYSNELVLEEYARRYFWTDNIRNEFDNEFFYSGHDEVYTYTMDIHERYDDVFLNLFDDHGWPQGFSDMMESYYLIGNQMYLSPSLTLAIACSTCHYSGLGDLLCIQGIRRGALAQQGAVDISYWHQEFDDILEGIILNGETIGEAYKAARNEEYEQVDYCGIKGDPFYAMLGDPTWRPKWW